MTIRMLTDEWCGGRLLPDEILIFNFESLAMVTDKQLCGMSLANELYKPDIKIMKRK